MHARSVQSSRHLARVAAKMVALATALLVGACSSGGSLENILASSPPGIAQPETTAKQAHAKTELDKAIDYWSEQYKKQPHDLKIALAYARNLKAAGHKDQAFGVLQGAALLHGDSTELASEYGRLALEYDQIAVADKLLAMADDPVKPDWKLISARGTVLAKQGKYAEAIPFYERALAVSPGQASVLNNLAMAHAAGGESAKAEEILRGASTASPDPRIKQNLALVLGLQGKHDEAKTVAAAHLPPETANADAEYIRRLVKADQTAAPMPAMPAVVTTPGRAAPTPARAIQAKSTPATEIRPSGGPNDVGAPAGSWAATVSRGR